MASNKDFASVQSSFEPAAGEIRDTTQLAVPPLCCKPDSRMSERIYKLFRGHRAFLAPFAGSTTPSPSVVSGSSE